MSAPQQKVGNAKTRPMRWKVISLHVPNAISWPGHFQGATTLNEEKVRGLKMILTSLDGFVVFQHGGKMGATNGVAVMTIEPVESAEE